VELSRTPYSSSPSRRPRRLGIIAKLGPGIESSNIKIGDRVGIKWMARVCGICRPCLSGRDGCCLYGKISGYEVPGSLSNMHLPIPDGLASDLAAPMLRGGVAVLKKCEAQKVSNPCRLGLLLSSTLTKIDWIGRYYRDHGSNRRPRTSCLANGSKWNGYEMIVSVH
jgi:hypothetical protein